MQQTFRRELLALGTLGDGDEAIDAACAKFADHVLAVHISERPSVEGVLDVLTAGGASRQAGARFTERYERLVWHAAHV